MSDQNQFGPQGTGKESPDTPPQHPNREALTPERAAGVHPQYHKGQLTHAGMQAVHASGGSVMYQGRVIPPGQPLPTEMDLAVGDEVAEQAVRDGIEVQRKALDEQERKLLAAQGQRKRAADEAAKAAKNAPATDQSEDLESLTVSELHQRASDLNIEGRSELTTKADLVKAIRKAQK
jgi:hypothetical protein